MKCGSCITGLCKFCRKGSCSCTHTPVKEAKENLLEHYGSQDEGDNSGSLPDASDSSDDTSKRRTRKTRKNKRDSALKDQQSTGRKRAAKLFPLDRNAPCEWQRKANCGGGASPILGCYEGKQTDRHHGPEKAVTNNEKGNVHRLCGGCHHTWHATNDGSYDWNSPNITPHNPRDMTDDELFQAAAIDAKRRVDKLRRISD